MVTLRGLRAGTKYSYWVAWQDAPTLPSTPTTFSTKHTSLDYAPRLAVFGTKGASLFSRDNPPYDVYY